MNKMPITDRECDELLLVKIRFYLNREMPKQTAREILEQNIKEKSNLEKLWNSLVSSLATNNHSEIIA
jgi:hypothetical protein